PPHIATNTSHSLPKWCKQQEFICSSIMRPAYSGYRSISIMFYGDPPSQYKRHTFRLHGSRNGLGYWRRACATSQQQEAQRE
ncbi:MAG: hypothetical protein ABL869_12905, partial [Candidatus Nitrotoga sp.]